LYHDAGGDSGPRPSPPTRSPRATNPVDSVRPHATRARELSHNHLGLRTVRIAIFALTFVFTLTIRIWGIGTHFLLLGDQMRDWAIAMRSLTDLPLIGPPTHVHGYTVGPAFYWILWAIRVCVGPWSNLPHAGGIGQAALQSAADTLLLAAIWRRTQSPWIAIATVVVLATAPFDLALGAVIWNPVMGSTLAKMATAVVLLDWHRRSPAAVALTAALAWSAVHVYTGAIYVAVSVFCALLADPFARGDRRQVRQNALLMAIAVALLQLPYVIHQVTTRFGDSAMSAVTGSVWRILSGSDLPEFAKSVAGYAAAFNTIQVTPWQVPLSGALLLICGGIVAVRYRRDPVFLIMMLVPQITAIVGYALFLGALDGYYYLSLMPAAVMTIVMGLTSIAPGRSARAIGIGLLLGALAIVPARLRLAATMFKMPEYRVLVDASRTLARRGQPIQKIQTEFKLPPTGDREFIYRLLGGRIDRQSPWIVVITAQGTFTYRKVDGS